MKTMKPTMRRIFPILCSLALIAVSAAAQSEAGDWQSELTMGNSPIAAGEVAGTVEEPILDSAGNESITGWACVVGLGESISVQLFRGGLSTDGGALVGSYTANAPSDAGVSSVCEDSGVNHGFSIPIPSSLRTQYPGQRLYIYGVDPVSQSNVLLASDGGAHIYATKIFKVEATDTDATNAIQTAINNAQNYVWKEQHVANPPNPNAYAEVLLSAGDFKIGTDVTFANFCFILTNSQNLVFGGAGLSTKLILQNPIAGGFQGYGNPDEPNPKNVTFVGFLMDELYPPFTQGTITAVNEDGSITIAIDPGMPLLSNAEYEPQNNVGGNYGMIFNSDAAHPHIKQNTPGSFCTVPVNPQPSDAITNSWKLAIQSSPTGCGNSTPLTGYAKVGDRYVQIARNGIGWMMTFNAATNLAVDGVTIYAGPDMATIWGYNSGRFSLNDLQIRRSPNPQVPIPGYTMPGTGTYRALSTNGDGVHYDQNWAAPKITNSFFESIGDDSINIHSGALPLTPTNSSISRFSYTAGAIAVKVGDKIQVVDVNSGAAVGETRVSGTRQLGSQTFDVKLSPAITGLNSTDQYVAFDVSADGPNAVIKNNTFITSVQSHGLLLESTGATITGNTFTGVGSAGIGLYSVPGAEGPNPTNVTITGNTFSDGTTGAVWRASFAGQISIITPNMNWGLSNFLGSSNIKIDSNTFSNYASGFPPVYIGAAKNIFLNNNHVISSSGETGLKLGSTVIVKDSTNVQIHN